MDHPPGLWSGRCERGHGVEGGLSSLSGEHPWVFHCDRNKVTNDATHNLNQNKCRMYSLGISIPSALACGTGC
jgi:hypothetical protein